MKIVQKDPIIVELGEGVAMTFLHIPAGRLRMGQRGGGVSQDPVTVLEVEEFWMGETPVTQEQYRRMAEACTKKLKAIEDNLGSEPSEFRGGEDSLKRPVEKVNWYEARVVAKWLKGRMREAGTLPSGCVVDLPPEALWEYACRAGTDTEYWSGDGEAALAEVAWYDGNSGCETHPVGDEHHANPWGLYDMHGNVWEWCADVWDAKVSRKRVDGWKALVWGEADAGEDAEYWSYSEERRGRCDRVLRGNSWNGTGRGCRAAFRYWGRPDLRSRCYGFRLCVFPGPVKQGPKAQPEAESASGAKERRDDAAVAEHKDGSSSGEATEDKAQAGVWDEAKFPPRGGDGIF